MESGFDSRRRESVFVSQPLIHSVQVFRKAGATGPNRALVADKCVARER